jgi:hypothetical protein
MVKGQIASRTESYMKAKMRINISKLLGLLVRGSMTVVAKHMAQQIHSSYNHMRCGIMPLQLAREIAQLIQFRASYQQIWIFLC